MVRVQAVQGEDFEVLEPPPSILPLLVLGVFTQLLAESAEAKFCNAVH